MLSIQSKNNSRLKLVQRIRSGKEKGLILIEGVRLVNEAIGSGMRIRQAFLSATYAGQAPTEVDLLEQIPGCETAAVPDNIFRSFSYTKNPQGIAVIADRPSTGLPELTAAINSPENRLRTAVMLSEVNNPGNLGAVIRATEAAGAAGVITSPGSADPFSPACLRSAMGSSFRLPVAGGISFADAAIWAGENGLSVTCVDAGGETPYTEVDWTAGRVLVFGSEAHGLTSEALAGAVETVFVPMSSPVESLNLAVSAGVILFEARRQIGSA